MTEPVPTMSSTKRFRRKQWLTALGYLCLMLVVFLYHSESAHRVLFGQVTELEFVVTDAATGSPVPAEIEIEVDDRHQTSRTFSLFTGVEGRAVFLRSDDAEGLHVRIGRMMSTRFGLRWCQKVKACSFRSQGYKGDPRSMKWDDLGWSEEKKRYQVRFWVPVSK
jgi:hypothetical protein